MKNCLVTKLKATVNNPSLPIIETMQQFTLDAITASGNSSMTDAQRWALNHFFYSLGTFNDDDANTIWNKLDSVVIPMLATDVNHCAIDYKDNQNYAYSVHVQYIALSNNGIYATQSTTCSFRKEVTNVDVKNIAIIQLNAGHSKKNSRNICITHSSNVSTGFAAGITLDKGNVSENQMVGIGVNSSIGYRNNTNPPSDLTAISLNGVNGTTIDNSSFYTINDGSVQTSPLSIYQFTDYTQENAYILNMLNTNENMNPLQVAIVGKNLNSTDTQKLAQAVYDFRASYLG